MSLVRLTLGGLVLFGLWGSTKLAWQQALAGGACPLMGPVPACYIAFASYVAMTAGLAMMGRRDWSRRLFLVGLLGAGGLALIGSLLELVQGHVCPRAGIVPMCYLSLGFCVLIGVLFSRAYPSAGRA